MLGQQPSQRGDVPVVNRLDGGDRERILGVEDHHIGVAIHTAHRTASAQARRQHNLV